ncbi:MAG: glutamate 5-kinase [Clostridiales bacterium]|nr:glutamate 5-kinase [Clostridiales bacterium]MBR5416684.1 glutamate 5-kinase [Clostridiales bacterium]
MGEEERQGRHLITEAKRVVVKVGTSTITYENGRMNMRNMDRLARAIADLMNSGREVVLVTSGAIGVGVGCLDLPERPSEMRDKQAVAAVGQCELMNVYSRCFAEYSRVVAQILLTKDGIDDPITRTNISNTMEALIEKGILPVVNENDTVSTAEMPHAGTFGDNDTLSALVARVVNADLLIILSDIDAVYDSNPKENPDAKRISVVTEVSDELIKGAGGAGSALGTGGMQTKILAMSMLMDHGIAGVIAEGSQSQILEDILDGEDIGTLFVPHK